MNATLEPTIVTASQQPLDISQRLRANLRRIMAASNVSQQQLAEWVTRVRGVATTRESIKAILNRASAPSVEWVEIFSRALSCDESELTAAVSALDDESAA